MQFWIKYIFRANRIFLDGFTAAVDCGKREMCLSFCELVVTELVYALGRGSGLGIGVAS